VARRAGAAGLGVTVGLPHQTRVLPQAPVVRAARVVTASFKVATVAMVATATQGAKGETAAALRPATVAGVATVATATEGGLVRPMVATLVTEVVLTAMETRGVAVLVGTGKAVRSVEEKVEKAAREVTRWGLVMLATEEQAAAEATTLSLRAVMAAMAVEEETVAVAEYLGRVELEVLAAMVGGG
jgi:hypothetical protein